MNYTNKSFIKGNEEIQYRVKSNPRSKKIRISVNADGLVTISKPTRISIDKMDLIVKEKFDWIQKTRKEIIKRPKKILAHHSTKEYEENREKALELAKERAVYFNQFYGHSFKSIFIKNQKTRWGSCSNKGNLTFNYKIVFLPKELQDYIIVHELCHLKEMNHSQSFWDLVIEQIPDYKLRRSKIKLF